MANVEGDIPNVDDLIKPGEDPSPTETAAEPHVGPVATEAKPAKPAEPPEPPAEKESKPGLGKLLLLLPIAVAIGLPVIVLGLALFGFVYFSTAIYIIAMGFIPLALWMGRKTNTVYVVFLACVLAAVLTAVYCLWIEIGRYKFDVKAQEAKQRGVMAQPIDKSRGLCQETHVHPGGESVGDFSHRAELRSC